MLKQLLLLGSNIPAALSGGLIFLLGLLGLHLGIPLSAGLAVVGYVISGLLIFPAKTAQENQQQAALHTVLKEGRQKLAQMHTLSRAIKNVNLNKQIQRICGISEKIFATVKQRPERVRVALQFSTYYLDTTLKIMHKYIELSEHQAYSADIKDSLKKVEQMLNEIETSFEKQLVTVLSDDVSALSAEMSMLQETIDVDKL